MKKTLIAASIATATLVTTNVVLAADKNMYVGASYDMMTIDVDGLGVDFDTSVLSLKAGTSFTENLGVEVVYGTGLSDESISADGDSVSLGVKSYYGLYLTGLLPITDQFNITSKLGYTNTTIEAKLVDSSGTLKEDDDDGSVSWGIGASFDVTQEFAVTADYTMLNDQDDGDVSGFTIGAKYNF